MSLRIVFMGTPDFAVAVLECLLAAGHDVVAVYTQPARQRGRGHKAQVSSVAKLASERGLLVRGPAHWRDPAEAAAFRALKADIAVVVAYGLILPAAILTAPKFGCVNLHASKLPRWRGAAPIERAIMAGDTMTAATVMQMDQGLDTGPILAVEIVPIAARETTATLKSKLVRQGASLMLAVLDDIAAGRATPVNQTTAGVTYAPKIAKSEGRIDWRRAADELDRLVRALNDAPGVWFAFGDARIKVRAAVAVAAAGPPGRVLDGAPTIACGRGALRLEVLQRAGRAPQDAAAFLRGFALPPGAIVG